MAERGAGAGAGSFEFNISGPVHQFNPTQGNHNTGVFNVNQRYEAAEREGNPTRDIPISTDEKVDCSSKNSSTPTTQKEPDQNAGDSMASEITITDCNQVIPWLLKSPSPIGHHQLVPSQANRNPGKTSK